MINLIINSNKITAEAGKTILQISRENGIDIPSLCHDERLEAYGGCGICMVEIEGNPRLIRACSTFAADGMAITTESERIQKNRRFVLELMLSDHTGDCKPPCTLACPAGTDCQGYIKQIAQGDFGGAWERVREKVPFPGSIGRVCPRPCEDACRRQFAEEPLAIAALKQFVGDYDDLARIPTPKKHTGKTVAVIGGGPAGLTAAYFLYLKGHNVTIYEAMPELGGMLHYGIPEYRLPKALLQKEIALICDRIANVKMNTKVALDDVKDKYDAVIVAIGAWNSVDLGRSIDFGVEEIGGIEYLRERPNVFGKKVAVIGGGNTAMDTCRTALRSGAEKVYCVYRRTRDVMPANPIEVDEAEEEGVIFMFQTNPVDIPRGLADIIITAIGQKPNLDGFEALEKTKWGTIIADSETFRTNLENVFAIGDATNKGADIAIAAIGEGGRCAEKVDEFLGGESAWSPSGFVKDESTNFSEKFADYEKLPRVKTEHRPPNERVKDFKETYTVFNEEAAKKEAARCLECGCSAYREKNCKLFYYGNIYSAFADFSENEKFSEKSSCCSVPDDDHDKIVREPEKCILCGLCTRVCEEVEGVTALGFSGRGFDTMVKPALGRRLRETGCNSCGKCAEVCPTGALTVGN